VVSTTVSSGAGSGITGKKEHNILQTTKAWMIVLKHTTDPVN
jgi:hypothetical protein